MINYQKAKFRELAGPYEAIITEVEAEPNQYFDPDRENSTEETLTISFSLTEPETGDDIPYTQRFISPLTFGSGLFQQLLDLLGYGPDEEGGEFDEQSLVGLKLMVNITKNKKGYNTIDKVKAAPSKSKKAPSKKKSAPAVDEDLPY